MDVPFHKMEGCGNDFVVVYRADLPPGAGPALAVAACDRRFGIGADGVLVLDPPGPDGAPPAMEVWNADGSVAEMCGNGLRCAVRRLVQDGLAGPGGPGAFATGAGVVPTALLGDEVRVGLAAPRVLDAEPLTVRGVAGHRVDAGNPHFVAFADAPTTPADLLDFGPALETDAAFPARTNVERVEVAGDRALRMRVWERGVGETLACGSGAVAAAAAAVATGRVRPGEVTVALPGGVVRVDCAAAAGPVAWLTGPARTVYAGRWRID